MSKQNLWLTASLATMAAAVVALGIGLTQMSTTGKGSELFLAGFIGAHLAALPLHAASRC
jgi:anti-sigma-K factor RskA